MYLLGRRGFWKTPFSHHPQPISLRLRGGIDPHGEVTRMSGAFTMGLNVRAYCRESTERERRLSDSPGFGRHMKLPVAARR